MSGTGVDGTENYHCKLLNWKLRYLFMNTLLLSRRLSMKYLRHQVMLRTRRIGLNRNSMSFADNGDTDVIGRIYVINLDRKPDRWRKISQELRRISSRSGKTLYALTRRFSAVDARYLGKQGAYRDLLLPSYTLADQLTIEPNPLINIDDEARLRRIDMTPQEVAVALSHISVWRLIASSNNPYTLVLEDDAYFKRNFAQNIDALWHVAVKKQKEEELDLLYLSFEEVGEITSSRIFTDKLIHRPNRGLWQASGYVLSRAGAKKLLKALPAYGPIDLWLNLQFQNLNVMIANRPIIEQRVDVVSTNSYSVMPVLSQIGVYTYDKPLLPQCKKLPQPIFACGGHGTGLTSLATALSMLGYTCCNDTLGLPEQEKQALFAKNQKTHFNAYINVGYLDPNLLVKLAKLYPKAKFIMTSKMELGFTDVISSRIVRIPPSHNDKWSILCNFLNLDYPSFPYPNVDDIGQRDIEDDHFAGDGSTTYKHLLFDSSPWIISSREWKGINIKKTQNAQISKALSVGNIYSKLNKSIWRFRDDTFPSNLALFSPDNVSIDSTGIIDLTLEERKTSVRNFVSAAIVTRKKYLYGKFSAEIKPSNVRGLITGLFLHRNSPHQEIDIEFLGKDTTKMLINVFYNPGVDGVKLEYGYRGTPTVVDLGFDAADEFHEYGIEWCADSIRWIVDGKVIYRRAIWNPTPIPNLPMEFNVNLWHSRSKELAGRGTRNRTMILGFGNPYTNRCTIPLCISVRYLY